MKVRRLVLGLALLAIFASDSWGQSKQQPPKANPQNTTQQERGTENSPVVVKILPTEKSETELHSEKEKQETDRQIVRLTDDLAKYTKLLFFATAALLLVTPGLFIFGYSQSKDA